MTGKVEIFEWPAEPPMPAPGAVVLVRVRTGQARAVARHWVRAVLRRVLARWSGLPEAQLPLTETGAGPLWTERLEGEPWGISLAYAGGDGWIAVRRGGAVGLDALVAVDFPEWLAVARLYLGAATAGAIESGPDPERAFAEAWTRHEARLKLHRLPLTEWPVTWPSAPVEICHPAGPSGVVLALAVANH